MQQQASAHQLPIKPHGCLEKGGALVLGPRPCCTELCEIPFFFNAFQSGSWAWQLQEQKHSVQAVPQQVEFPFQHLTRVQ